MPEHPQRQGDGVTAEILREVRETRQHLDSVLDEQRRIRDRAARIEEEIDALKARADEGAEVDEAWRDAKRWSRLMLRVLLTGAALVTALAVIFKQGGDVLDHFKQLLIRR